LGASQLLQLLARLPALQELKLDSVEGDWPQQQLAQYSALTASSNLQELRVSNSSIPGAVWAHVFPAGRQLPKFQRFTIHWDVDNPPAAFDSTAIARLVSCCPDLKDLYFTTQPDAALNPLQSLSALTHLNIGPVIHAAVRSDLTALSQLQRLEVSVSLPAAGADGVADSGLQDLVPLTALTALTWLQYWDPYVRLHSRVSEWLVLLSLTALLNVHAASCF
jgi:hypothetical protein